MPKLPSFRRLNRNDFELQYQQLIDQLGTSINNGFDVVYGALNGSLSFTDNFNSTLTTISITVNDQGVPKTKAQFKLKDGQNTLRGLIILNVTGADLVGAPYLVFQKGDENIITITKAFGLSSNKTYNITILGLS